MAARLLISCLLATQALATIPSLSGYKLQWSDDFDGAHYAAVNHANWEFVTGRWTNNGEWETYRDSTTNAHLSGDGQLYITPTKENGVWYSARLHSEAAYSCDDGHAMIFQAEIWVPNFTGSPAKFAGLWPAFWTKGQSNRFGTPWPQCGEWDIFEVTNKMSNRNQGTLHFSKAAGCNSGSACDDGSHSGSVYYEGGKYHTWAFKVDRRNAAWQQQKLIWYLDGQEFFTVTGSEIGEYEKWQTLAAKAYYIILNVAIGGGYPGDPTEATVSGFDASMRVKYAAIYKST